MTHMISRPFAGRNAIEAAVFALRLQQPLDMASLQRIDTVFDQQASDPQQDGLPGKQLIQFQAGPGLPFPPNTGELLRFVSLPSGAHAWRLQVQAHAIVVTCHQYSRFDAVWPRAQRYFDLTLEAIGAPCDVMEVSHQVLDRFQYNTAPGLTYDLAELFKRGSDYLTPKAWNSGLLWHVHQGWFDESDDGFKHLHQVNLSNNLVEPNLYATLIDHRATSVMKDGSPIALGQDHTLSQLFGQLHASNRALLLNLLTPEKLAEIGIRNAA